MNAKVKRAKLLRRSSCGINSGQQFFSDYGTPIFLDGVHRTIPDADGEDTIHGYGYKGSIFLGCDLLSN